MLGQLFASLVPYNLFIVPIHSYEIEQEGPVQQISYASDTESGYLRLVSEDDLEKQRWDSAWYSPPLLLLHG